MSDVLTQYFKQVGKHKLLTKQEEVMLAKRIEAGDDHAREKMITANLRLAVSISGYLFKNNMIALISDQ